MVSPPRWLTLTDGPMILAADVSRSSVLPACAGSPVERGQAAPFIQLRAVTMEYALPTTGAVVLRDVELAVRAGEFLAITGPSGCGKTTLLSILGLLQSPTEGSYTLAGRPVERLDATERARVRNHEVGFVFQSFNLIGDLTVRENVELPLAYRRVPAEERRSRAEQALLSVGLGNRLDHAPGSLSGGEQQRVALARAVVGRPSLLLADEPTGNLDSVNGEQVMEMLQQMNAAGVTVCMVTHDSRHRRRAGRVVELLDGRVEGGGVA